LLVRSEVKLSELFGRAKNKLDIIVTFLSVLELIRVKEIIARQSSLFEDIEILRNKENIIPYERRDETSAS
jgi:segregation and condensation protein A